MGLIGAITHTVARAAHTVVDDVRGKSTPKDTLEPAKAKPKTTWWAGRPLSEGKNAHKTNTVEQFNAALKDGSNWFEGDVRKELHGDRIEMRHNTGPETGDNLTLEQWLQKGKASGRGLKLDVKDSFELPGIIKETKAAGIDPHKLMWNLGDGELNQYGAQIRKEFPGSIMAINTSGSAAKMDDAEVNRMIAHAKKLGAPVTFVERYDRLTPSAIKKLEQVGPISVWNDPGRSGLSNKNIDDVTAGLRRQGVSGIVDLRPSLSTVGKLEEDADVAKNVAGEFVRNGVHKVLDLF